MREVFNLNCAPIDQYPVSKVLTKSDMTTSQLVLPRHSVEEFIIPNMPEPLRNSLIERGHRANIWVVDDENGHEHFLTMVDRNHRYLIISWGLVRHSRELREGQQVRFRWVDHKLHFVVVDGDNNGNDEDPLEDGGNNRPEGQEEPGKGIDENIVEPPAKRMKTDMGEPSTQGATNQINP